MSNCKPIQLYWTNTPTTFQQEREVIMSAQLTWKHTWYQRQEKRKISEQNNCFFFFQMWTLATQFFLLCGWNVLKHVNKRKKTVASTREKEIKERLTRNCLKMTKKLFPPTLTPATYLQLFHIPILLLFSYSSSSLCTDSHHCYSRSQFHVCCLDLNVWFFPSNLPILFLCLRLLQSVSLPLREIKVEADVVLMAISSSCADTFTVCAAYLLN